MLLVRFYFVFVSPSGLDKKMTPEIVSALCLHCIYGAILLFLCIDTAAVFIDFIRPFDFLMPKIAEVIRLQTKISLTHGNG